MMTKKRAAVTGATGFLGGKMAAALAEQGYEVHALRRPNSPMPVGLPVIWHEGDITQPATLPPLLARSDVVVHAAGILGAFGVSDDQYRQINVTGAQNLLAACAEISPQPKRILFVGSAGVLGPLQPGHSPIDATEECPMAPSNGYERSKAEAELVAQSFAAKGLPVVIARPEFVYGGGDTHVLGLFKAIQRGLFFYIGDGGNSCHPTYIEDAVAGMTLCLKRGQVGEAYHIAGKRPVTFRELAETIAAELDVKPPRVRLPVSIAVFGAQGLEWAAKIGGFVPPLSRTGVAFFSENRGFNISKAQNALGYAPQFSLQEGIAKTVAWYRENGHLN